MQGGRIQANRLLKVTSGGRSVECIVEEFELSL